MRVISLLPGATDTIVALGGAGMLVGISHACTGPDGGTATLASLPRVTSSRIDSAAASGAIDAAVRDAAVSGAALFVLDEDAIVRLRPDLIITQALCDVCAISESDVRALATRVPSPPRILALSGTTMDGILADIAAVADALQLRDEGEELVAGLRRRMRTVHDTLKAARAPRPRVAVIEWTNPLFTAGHWVPEQVRRAGGTEVLGAAGAHSRVATPAELREADPEIVIVAPCGLPLARAATEGEALIAHSPWLAGRAVWAIAGDLLTSRPGPAVVAGIEVIARIVAPGCFAPLNASQARLLTHG